MAKWKPGEYCDRCNNTGEVDCYCGGDLCVCDNYGEMVCPRCDGRAGQDVFADGELYDERDDEPVT